MRSSIGISFLPFVIALASAVSGPSFAQGVSLIGNTGYAQTCFQASNMAARTQIASFKDLQICTKAIDFELLHRRDLIATYVNRGIIYAALERIEAAEADYEKAMAMDDTMAATYLNRGNLWFAMQDYARAIDDYSRSLELDISQPHVAFLNRGLAHEYRGNLIQAEKDYQSSLVLRPGWRDARLKLERVERKMAN